MLRSLQKQYRYTTQLGENLILLGMPSVKMNMALLELEMAKLDPRTRNKSVTDAARTIHRLEEEGRDLGVKVTDQVSRAKYQEESTYRTKLLTRDKDQKKSDDAHQDRLDLLDKFPQTIYEEQSVANVIGYLGESYSGLSGWEKVKTVSDLNNKILNTQAIKPEVVDQAIRDMIVKDAGKDYIRSSKKETKLMIEGKEEDITVEELKEAWKDTFTIGDGSTGKAVARASGDRDAGKTLVKNYQDEINTEYRAGGGIVKPSKRSRASIEQEVRTMYAPDVKAAEDALFRAQAEQDALDEQIAGMGGDPFEVFKEKGMTSFTQMPFTTTKQPRIKEPRGERDDIFATSEEKEAFEGQVENWYPRGFTVSRAKNLEADDGTKGSDVNKEGNPNYLNYDWAVKTDAYDRRLKQDDILNKSIDKGSEIKSGLEKLTPKSAGRRAQRLIKLQKAKDKVRGIASLEPPQPNLVGDDVDEDIVGMQPRRQARAQARLKQSKHLTEQQFETLDLNDDESLSEEEKFLPGKVIEGFGKIIEFTEDPVTGRIDSVTIRTPEGKTVTINMAAEIDKRRKDASNAIQRLQDLVDNGSMDAEDAKVQIDEIINQGNNFENKSDFEIAFEKVKKDMVD